MSLYNVEGLGMRVASPSGGTVSVRWDAPDGPEIGRVTVPNTGDWQAYTMATTAITDVPEGTGTLYFVNVAGQMNVNWLEFDGRGVTDNVRPTIDTFEVTPTEGTAPLEVTASVTATDPEDEAVTFAWDAGLGDGFVDGTDSFAVTYDQPGTYRLQVRATDERGAYSVEYTTVTVKAPETGPGLCFSGRSDDFLGTDLDEDRWTVTNRDQNLVVRDGRLVVPTATRDFYGTDNTAVPNLVLQDLPDGPFTATAKVTLRPASSTSRPVC